MFLIKFLSVLLLIPVIYPIKKLLLKKELNFFDFILIFSVLFFAIVPLKSDEIVYESIGLLTKPNSLFVFYCLLFYFIILIILSKNISQKNSYPINITLLLKEYPTIQANLFLKIILIIIPIFSITYYVPKMSIISAFSEIRESSSSASYEESSLVKYFATIFSLSLIVTLKLFFQNIKEKKIDILVTASILIFLVNLVLLPRRQLLVFGLFGAVLFYSTNRELINKKFLLIFSLAAIFMYTVYFPFYNIIRWSPIQFNLNNPVESIQGIYNYGVSSYGNSKDDASELTDARAIGLYRAVYWLTRNETFGDATWGEVTLAAVDHAIPKIINPGKGLGSETILERRMLTPNDSADSVFLLALADFSFLASLFTALIYLAIYRLLLLISEYSEKYLGKTIVMYFLTFFIFQLTFSVEQKLDGILANIISFILTIFLIALLHKMKVISLEQSK